LKTRIVALAAIASIGVLGIACRDIVGIHTITLDEGGTTACNGSQPTLVFSSASTYDVLFAQGGFVYAEVEGSGVDRCAIAGCATPTSVIQVGSNTTFDDSTLTPASIDYTVLQTTTDGGSGGEIHTAGLDGTNDKISFGTSTQYPANIAVTGARVFWVDDEYDNSISDTDTVDCVGCNGTGDSPWITGLAGGAYGLVADSTNVYVLADTAALTDLVVLGCSITTACGASPRTVIASIDASTVETQMASDGTFFYIARENHDDVVRVDQTGAVTQVLTSQDVIAIAVDATAGNLYYGTSTGTIGRVKTDGSAQPTTLACNQDTVTALAVDDQNVYFLAGSTTSNIFKLPK
jgi:hypothetical protein